MPSVNIPSETYEALRERAARQGCTPDSLAQLLLESRLTRRMTDEEWKREWAELRARVQAALPPGITDEEIEADIAEALAEVRTERARAGGS